MIMTYFESGNWCLYYQSFLNDKLVNFTCPRAMDKGCYSEPKCEYASFAVLVDGVKQ